MTNLYTRASYKDFDSALLNYAVDLAGVVEMESSAYSVKLRVPKRDASKSFPFVENNTSYTLRNLNGDILSTSSDQFVPVPYLKELALSPLYTHRFLSVKDTKGNYFRAVNLKVIAYDRGELILQVATRADLLEEQQGELILINAITIPLLIIISSLAAYYLSGNALSSIQLLTTTAQNIAAANLSMRVPVVHTGDEVEELAKTINTLLERLQKAFEAQEHFVANASHQLNTPLAIIKGELDVLQSKERSPEEHTKFLVSLKEEVARLTELVRNMLLISRVEAGKEAFSFSRIHVDDLIISVISRLGQGVAREKNIQLRFNIDPDLISSDELEMLGERQLLDCLLENIIENAIKYSQSDSTVEIKLKCENKKIIVSVQDSGPGIKPSDWTRILESRFTRGSETIMTGSGIGLNIAFKIAEHHGAEIKYQPNQPHGSQFLIYFKQA